MGLRKPHILLTKKQFNEAYNKGGWREVFKIDKIFNDLEGLNLKTKIYCLTIMNILIYADIVRRKIKK